MTKGQSKIKKVKSTSDRLRLCVFKSNSNIYAQIIDDQAGNTLVSASSLKSTSGGNVEGAKTVGKSIAEVAKKCSIKKVVFDKRSYPYKGRVRALAESARANGLEF